MRSYIVRGSIALGALLSIGACSGGDSALFSEEHAEIEADSEALPDSGALAQTDSPFTHAPPRLATAEEMLEIWSHSQLGRYERAAKEELSVAEQQGILDLLAIRGIPNDEVTFAGSNVWIGDTFVDVQADLASSRGETVLEKGKVLNEIITGQLRAGVQGAPIQYARQEADGNFLFARPEVSGFSTFLVLPDDVPTFIRDEFTNAVAAIGNASADDCLGPEFLKVRTRAEFSPLVASPFSTPVRQIEVIYAPDPCPHAVGSPAPNGCAQFPKSETVALAAATPFAGGIAQRRVLFGGYVAINSDAVNSTSTDFSTFTHELLHTMGVAHPTPDEFASQAVAAKLVVPGTESTDDGFTSVMAARGSPERVFALSADDIDVIGTLYSRSISCNLVGTFSIAAR